MEVDRPLRGKKSISQPMKVFFSDKREYTIIILDNKAFDLIFIMICSQKKVFYKLIKLQLTLVKVTFFFDGIFVIHYYF